MDKEFDPTYTVEDLNGVHGKFIVEKDIEDGVTCTVLSFLSDQGEIYCLSIDCEEDD